MNPKQPLTIQDLPIEVIEHIFGYLSSLMLKNHKPQKTHLYQAARTCRLFAEVAVPRLWYDLDFHLDDNNPLILPYQRSFLQALTPASSRNFKHTRRLTLTLYSLRNPVDVERMVTIHDRLLEFLSIYQFASPYLKYLDLAVDPLPDGPEWEDWPIARACNQIIYFLARQISLQQTDFEEGFAVEITSMGDDPSCRPHIDKILSLLGPKITDLELYDEIPSIVEHLPTMTALRHFGFHNLGESDEGESEMLWRVTSQLSSISDLMFSYVDYLPNFNIFASHVTELALNDIDDIISACVVCYTQMPHLRQCVFNDGQVKDEGVARETVLKDTCCTRLDFVGFRESFAPAGIVSIIAKKNPHLRYCGAPTNISDDDIRQLQMHCPRLGRFYMSLMDFDPLTPRSLVSVRGLLDLSRMPRLGEIILHSCLLKQVDRNVLSQWAWSSKFEGVEFCQYDVPAVDVKVFLSGDDSFKEWMAEFVTLSNDFCWRVDMDKLRGALGKIGLDSSSV
jgi:F-box-like